MIELEHVGIAVREVAPVLRILEELIGEQPYKSETVTADAIRTHFLSGGGTKLELLESIDATSPVARFLDKHGEGLHHLAFEVEDVDAAHRRLRSIGYEPLDEAPRRGADGKRIFFLHPRDTAGVLVEFCQSDRPVLKPARTSGDLRIRSAGRADGPHALFVCAKGTTLPPDELVQGLERRFSVLAVEWDEGDEPARLDDVLDDRPVHVIGIGDAARSSLSLAAEGTLHAATLTLYHPAEFAAGSVPPVPILLIGRDRQHLDATVALAKRFPHARLALFPDDDPRTAARLIERHALRT